MTDQVLVSLNGSPESLVAAWLLKRQGVQIKGIYFDFLDGIQVGADSSQNQIATMERILGIPVQHVKCGTQVRELIKKEIDLQTSKGFLYDIPSIYVRQFFFPQLFKYREQYSLDKIATGFKINLNHEPMNRQMKISRYSSNEQDQSPYLLGLSQDELMKLIFPLGNIPSSMIDKLISELELKREPDPIELLRGLAPQSEQKKGEVKKVNPKDERIIQEIWFDEAHWFSGIEPGFSSKSCSMAFDHFRHSIQVKLIQFEGSTLKAFLEKPVPMSDVHPSSGDQVLWIDHDQILGGARVVSLK